MKKFIGYISFILAAVLCALIFCGCVTGSFGEETTKKEETAENTADASDTEVQSTEKSTYTVPLYMEKDGVVQYEFSYDPEGASFSKTDNTEESPITYTVFFDEKGLPLRREWCVTVNDTRTENWRDDYYLDEDGRIIDEKRYCEGEIQNAYTYTYDEEGRIATQESRNLKKENIIYRLLYDDMGTHIGTRYKKYTGESGYYKELREFEYDSDGRITDEITDSYTAEYEYTFKGDYLTVKKITYKTEGYSWSYYYSYTYENGKLIREDCSFDGVLTSSTYYTETEYEHFSNAIDRIFGERLP